MKILLKITPTALVFGSLLFTACGGGDEVSSASDDAAVAEPSLPDAPAEAISMIASELAAGNGAILWEAMPATYQMDVNSIAQLAGSKVDAELYNKGFELIGRIVEVADKQKTFILNTELGGVQPAEEIAKMEAAWPEIMGFLNAFTNSSIASSDGLKAFDGESFFSTTVSELIKYSEGMAAVSGEEMPFATFDGMEISALETSDTSATLQMAAPDGTIETEAFTRVDSRWVPADMAASWSADMANARSQLEAMDPVEMAESKPQILSIITMLEGVLIQIEGAETQEQFDQSLQGAMMPMMGIMMMMQGMGGAPSGPPSMPTAP